ncbi:hypothetical protein MIMGU_mgv1a019092mg [Erythranthe guttata]|uniref:Uncharacterized protein n=1 Tax=Erythranthe guttata TaxID=4155 RepID=A0A022QSC3_ERYGU|nr:hypothetical protein MIMGU_mgv1a019092mg [Erythranthe guttata]
MGRGAVTNRALHNKVLPENRFLRGGFRYIGFAAVLPSLCNFKYWMYHFLPWYTKNHLTAKLIPFSAFWLRSSVVSVLISISLISDILVLRASPMRCTTARAWRTPSIIV